MEFNETQETSGTTDETGHEQHLTQNFEGGEAFEPASPEMALYKNAVNNLLENTYYQEDTEALDDVREAFDEVAEVNPLFALKLAGYAQQELGLRDISNLLLVLSANDERVVKPEDSTISWVRDYAPSILARPDDTMTVLAMQEELFGSNIPAGLRKGVQDALHQWDAYQFAKYDTDRREYNLRDVVNLTHPTPQDADHDRIFERLIRGPMDEYEDVEPLDSPVTWEVVVSDSVADAIPDEFTQAKQDWVNAHNEEIELHFGEGAPRSLDEAMDAFEEIDGREYLFESAYTREDIEDLRREGRYEGFVEALDRMGLFAKIRNIRNMLDAGVEGEQIFGDEDMSHVKASSFFPFRFYQAYKAYEETEHFSPYIEEWLSEAMEATLDNVPDEWEDTFVAVDISQSMRNNFVSQNSTMDASEIATFFGAILSNAGADVGIFGSDFDTMTFHHDTPVISRQKQMLQRMDEMGGSTNAWKVLRHLNESDAEYNRLVFLTDMQAWDNTRFIGGGISSPFSNDNELEFSEETVKEWLDTYRHETNPELALYNLDLSSYGDLMTPEGYENVYNISGWTSDILEFVQYAEEPGDIIAEVETFEPSES